MAEFSDRGSRFIAYTFAVETTEEIKIHLKKIKELHPKAVHCCYAWRLGFDHTQFRANDDGEPSGSAGRPILGQIDSLQITNVLVAVIRYFGGVLLGIPGLIHAYKTSARTALTDSNIVEKNRNETYLLKFDYTRMNDVMRLVKLYHCDIKSQDLTLFCEMQINIALSKMEIVLPKIKDIDGIEIERIS